jgi:6-pyruvoyltetrahydropterin/6-carboxytetrahydropterin synthase
MLELRRTVRFCLSDGTPTAAGAHPLGSPRTNTYSAWPAMRGLGRYYELHVTCRGHADPTTGYFLNIKQIDEAVREHVLPDLEAWVTAPHHCASDTPMGELMRRVCVRLDEHLRGTVAEVALQLTPRYSLTIRSDDMDRVTVRQQYEFSAAHRLHVEGKSDEENRRIFGKCNNPAGHGHNYRVEVAVSARVDPEGHALSVEELDALIDRHAIQKLDHKHLNADVPQFAAGRLNPSVENIAKVVWEMLEDKLADAGPMPDTRLEAVTVWETEKTACTYRGERVNV